ncbi:unnamed protein product [Adineta steineri]|uniref:Uncharacterized protein n=1 Tax=Adineta steineri TaxID=433720 RepID=A0A814T396_9BILA|nr:unnamed protein product [Adineta steineri]
MTNGHSSMDIDDNDELLCELDVEFRRTEQSIYVFQYPIRPNYRSYDEISFASARIKEKHSLVEMDLLVDPQCSNYYSARGKQFADSTNNENGKQFFNSDRMDKQTIASTISSNGDCYSVGIFNNITRQLVLCPLKSIIQLRPQFNYLDSSSSTSGTTKDGNTNDDDQMNGSDGEQSGSESEENKPEPAASLVTMKFAKKESDYHKKKRLQSYGYFRQMRDDDRWQDLVCVMNAHSFDAQRIREKFLSNEKQEEQQQLTMINETKEL